MARARNIKPGLFKNELLGVADPLFTLLFEGLWVLADREGRLEDRPLRIKAEVFPYRDGLSVEDGLNWLKENQFILRYKAGGNSYIQIINFKKHQSPHKNEVPSEIPAPDKDSATSSKIGTASEDIGSTRADCLNLIPDSLKPIKACRASRSISPEGFADFWSRYPRKTARQAAEKAWKKLGPDDDLRASILAALEAQKASSLWSDIQFVPHAATWLNARRWEDEVPRETPKKPNGSPAWWSSDASIQAKANELGIAPRAGESWQQLKGRIEQRLGGG